MRVQVFYTGLLRRYIGIKEEQLELPEGATADDLIARVAVTYRDRFPANFLPEGQSTFTQFVRATYRGGRACGGDVRLEEGDQLNLLSRLAGG